MILKYALLSGPSPIFNIRMISAPVKTELDFVSFASDQGMRNTPIPLYYVPENNLALDTFLPGTIATSEQVSGAFVKTAIDFMLKPISIRKKNFD